MNKLLILLSLCGAVAAAQAHVVLEYQAAPAASSYKATFKVGHGCGPSATRQLVVQVPPAMQEAHPMPKSGWALSVQSQGDRITSVTWTAKTPEDKVPANFYDEFVLVARTPAEPGMVYWPVSQVCDEGRQDWTQVPAPGQKLSALKTPAAALEVFSSGEAPATHHH